jgi:hypothetical protein
LLNNCSMPPEAEQLIVTAQEITTRSWGSHWVHKYNEPLGFDRSTAVVRSNIIYLSPRPSSREELDSSCWDLLGLFFFSGPMRAVGGRSWAATRRCLYNCIASRTHTVSPTTPRLITLELCLSVYVGCTRAVMGGYVTQGLSLKFTALCKISHTPHRHHV